MANYGMTVRPSPSRWYVNRRHSSPISLSSHAARLRPASQSPSSRTRDRRRSLIWWKGDYIREEWRGKARQPWNREARAPSWSPTPVARQWRRDGRGLPLPHAARERKKERDERVTTRPLCWGASCPSPSATHCGRTLPSAVRGGRERREPARARTIQTWLDYLDVSR
jgi:hypothetical protein